MGQQAWHTLRMIGGAAAAGVPITRGDTDWDALVSKGSRISVVDEIFVDHDIVIDGNANVELGIIGGHIAPVCSSLDLANRAGTVKLINGCIGQLIQLQHYLTQRAVSEPTVAANADADELELQVPLWSGTYAFDLVDYPIPVSELGALSYQRGGASLMVTTEADYEDVAKLGVRGRFLRDTGKRRFREWIKQVPTGDEGHLPAGRYHAIFIVNAATEASGSNLYDSGIEVTGPNIQISYEDGRHLQRAWSRDWNLAQNTAVPQQQDRALQASGEFGLEDTIQPIYAPPFDSTTWESGVVGPITITKRTADPNMFIYALRVVE